MPSDLDRESMGKLGGDIGIQPSQGSNSRRPESAQAVLLRWVIRSFWWTSSQLDALSDKMPDDPSTHPGFQDGADGPNLAAVTPKRQWSTATTCLIRRARFVENGI